MSNPAGMRVKTFVGPSGAVHIYSTSERIILQVRREIPTEMDVLGPSFKSAVEIDPMDALALADELLSAATRIIRPKAGQKWVIG